MESMWTFIILRVCLSALQIQTRTLPNEPPNSTEMPWGGLAGTTDASWRGSTGDDGGEPTATMPGEHGEETVPSVQLTSHAMGEDASTVPSDAYQSGELVSGVNGTDGPTPSVRTSDAPSGTVNTPLAAPRPNMTNTVPGDVSTTELPTQEKIPIYIGGYFSFGGGWEGSGMLPACQMALDHINQRADVLPGYELKMVWNDTQCEAGLGTRVFFDQLFREPKKTMILGAPCSPASQIISGTAYYWNLIAISPSAASPGLSNREKYPLFYRTYMPDAMFNPVRIRLMREFGWKRVATIHENHEVFSLAIDDLLTLLKEANITVISSESFSEDPKNQIESLKSQDAKIIIGNMYAHMARRLFCEAYKQGMTSADYVWMLIGWYKDKWWLDDDDTITCSVDEMRMAVEGVQYISTESLPLSTSKEPTVAGITPAEYETLYQDRMSWPENQGYRWNSLGPFVYDAAWAIALTFNKSVEVLKTKRFSDGSFRRLEDFTYDDKEMAELFFNLLNETEFKGVSGPVAFKQGDRVGITQIEQLQGSCSEGWEKHRATCFKFVAEPMLRSAQAQAHCASLSPGASLAHIGNENEHDFLSNVSNSRVIDSPQKWLVTVLHESGGAKNASWTPHDSPADVTDNSACVVVDYQQDGRLQTIDCNELMPFICRVRAEFSEKQIAFYSALDDTLEWRSDIEWPGEGPPLDRTPVIIVEIIRQYLGVTPTLYFCICGVAAFCIVASLCFLAFNIKYRQQRHVKMSSPNLNNLIIVGALLVYMFVIVAGLDTNLVSDEVFVILCHVKTWVLSVGFVLAFGAMFSKTWRVHRVAAFKTPKRRIVTDGQLFLMVFVLLSIDVIILTLWQLIDPVVMETMDLYPQDDPEIPNRVIQQYVQFCTCDTLTYWLGALYGYKGLLLIFGTFLAWETRKVSIPGLNDSKLIGVSVYNVIILCLIGVAVSVVISTNPEALFAFVSCIILFCTSITLIVVFVPKIIAVVKYPDGDPAQSGISRSKNAVNRTLNSGTGTNTSLTAENDQLKTRIQELESQLDELKGRGSSRVLPGNGRGFGCWTCGLVCGFSPSRDYTTESGTEESQLPDLDTPAGSSTATARM
ncbi:uncharacterized protein LOC119738403 [Patiria miniata]|uniref:Gamma-aminobutyric acid type B receptor subunit 2 n=1 Tax=Patiria miniata TaxID=46514 RepID=A0A914AZT1_PATMI|nr:uncharacterized protein LOC119738403 [Patiria miniata]